MHCGRVSTANGRLPSKREQHDDLNLKKSAFAHIFIVASNYQVFNLVCFILGMVSTMFIYFYIVFAQKLRK